MRRKFMINNGSTNWGGGITLNINDLPSVTGNDTLNYLEIPFQDYNSGNERWIEVGGKLYRFKESSYYNMYNRRFSFDSNSCTFTKSDRDITFSDYGSDWTYNNKDIKLLDVTSENFKKGYFYVGITYWYGGNTRVGYGVFRCTTTEDGLRCVNLGMYGAADAYIPARNYNNYVHGDYFYAVHSDGKRLEKIHIGESSLAKYGETIETASIPDYDANMSSVGGYLNGNLSVYLNDALVEDVEFSNIEPAKAIVHYFAGEDLVPTKKRIELPNASALMPELGSAISDLTGDYNLLPLDENRFVLLTNFFGPDENNPVISFAQIYEFDIISSTFKEISSGYVPAYNNIFFRLAWGNKHKFLYNVYTGYTLSSRRHKYFWVWAE